MKQLITRCSSVFGTFGMVRCLSLGRHHKQCNSALGMGIICNYLLPSTDSILSFCFWGMFQRAFFQHRLDQVLFMG